MSQYSNADQLKSVVCRIGERLLSGAGFQQKGRAFHRVIEPGFVHIIEFVLGPSWSITHGQFTVDVLVFVKEAYEILYSAPAPSRPTGSHCELRMRLGMLDSPPADKWWSLSSPLDSVVADVENRIERLALPFLSRLAGRRALVDEWRKRGNDALGFKPRGNLVAAIVLKHVGDENGAQELLRAALLESTGRPTEQFFAQIASKLGVLTD
jgi:uncharacterized protein DUF4304